MSTVGQHILRALAAPPAERMLAEWEIVTALAHLPHYLVRSTLATLERDALVASRWVERAWLGAREPRYWITEKGRNLLAAAQPQQGAAP